MKKPTDLSRRSFLKQGTALGGSLVLGIQLPGCGPSENSQTLINKITAENNAAPAKQSNIFFPNAYLRITSDDQINIYVASSEMGQGVMTSLPMLLAEELEADWTKINAEFAPAHEDFENPRSGRQMTGGSASIRGFWHAMREAGAIARDMLLTAAAQTWNVEKKSCTASSGIIKHAESGRHLTFGQLAEKAQSLPVPEIPTPKDPKDFHIIGQPVGRLDSKIKTNGTAVFGQDVQLPDMLFATVAHCPVFEGKLTSFDANEAKKITGVLDIFEIETGVAIVANHFWTAKRARDLIKIVWDEGEYANLSSDKIRQQFIQAVNNGKEITSRGDTTKTFATSTRSIHAIYETPYLAHACMEPMNCTAYVQKDRCDIWVPTQGQAKTQKTGAEITGLSKEKIFVHTTFLGGGFGRRAEIDFVRDAVLISNKLKKPVKLIWTREDDIQRDFYRPASYNRLSASVDNNGNPDAWEHAIAAPSILDRIVPFAGLIFRGKDDTSTEGADNIPYDIKNLNVSYAMVNPGIPVGFWRSVGNSQNTFVTECFFDEVAALAKKDPFKLRQQLLASKPRHKSVLELAAQKANWGSKLATGHFQGIAFAKSFESFVAYVAEVSINNGNIKVHRVTAAVDCGIIINPDTVVAQIQSGIVFGLTAALYGEITIDKGRVQQNNFNDYPMLRFHEMPDVDVHLIKSAEPPGGVGEIGVPPIVPAVANAIFAATGKPVRKLPIRLENIT